MEIRIILRGALSGAIAGIFGFVFARIFAEPLINKAIAYEEGREEAINALLKTTGGHEHEVVSRSLQSTAGLATGIIVFGAAMGALLAVAYLVLHGRVRAQPRTVVLLLAGFGFLGVYAVPFCKYPASPPAVGHDFTIKTRTTLYLVMVVCSLLFLAIAAYAGHRLSGRFGTFNASLIAAAGFLVAIGIVMGLLPSLGELAANKRVAGDIGYGASATETPLPVRNPAGDIVYPGFDADVLWKFRFYSLLTQMLVWSVLGIIFGSLVQRVTGPSAPAPREPQRVPAGA